MIDIETKVNFFLKLEVTASDLILKIYKNI